MTNGTSGQQQQPEGISERLGSAIDDLRRAAEDATGDARSRIESAIEQVRQASDQATSRAQEGVTTATERAQRAAGDIRGQLDQIRSWIQSAGADVLDEIQKEIDKRRQQLFGGEPSGGSGGGTGGSGGGSGASGGGSAAS